MPRYLLAQVYVAPDQVTEYLVIPESRQDQKGYASHIFPEQYALQSTPNYPQQVVPAEYGIPGQPISPRDASG
jgi:hypothetical protein